MAVVRLVKMLDPAPRPDPSGRALTRIEFAPEQHRDLRLRKMPPRPEAGVSGGRAAGSLVVLSGELSGGS